MHDADRYPSQPIRGHDIVMTSRRAPIYSDNCRTLSIEGYYWVENHKFSNPRLVFLSRNPGFPVKNQVEHRFQIVKILEIRN